MRRGQPGWIEIRDLAEIERGLVSGQVADCRPEIQYVATGMASEAVIDLPGKMDGERVVRSGAAGGDGAWAAKLRAVP